MLETVDSTSASSNTLSCSMVLVTSNSDLLHTNFQLICADTWPKGSFYTLLTVFRKHSPAFALEGYTNYRKLGKRGATAISELGLAWREEVLPVPAPAARPPQSAAFRRAAPSRRFVAMGRHQPLGIHLPKASHLRLSSRDLHKLDNCIGAPVPWRFGCASSPMPS